MKLLLTSLAGLAHSFCEDAPNAFYIGNAWWQGNEHHYDGHIRIPDLGKTLKQWTVEAVFSHPTVVEVAWVAIPHKVDNDGRIWHFTAMDWDKEINGVFDFNFLAHNWDASISAEIHVCGDGDKPDGSSSSTTESPSTDPTTDGPDNTHPTLPPNDLCDGPSGRNVKESKQTKVGGWNNTEDMKYDYSEALHKSILFFEAQRAGPQPESNRVLWRGDSGLHDGCDVGADLSKGWFDAGDHVKFNFPMAFSSTLLGWGVIDYEDGYRAAGEYENVLDSLKWSFDYLMAAHPEPNKIYMQVGDGHADHAFWGRPEEMTMTRPTFTLNENAPGTDLACETAAALATCYMIFKESEPDYAAQCLRHAEELYSFGENHRAKYSDSSPQVANFYNSWSGYNDELAWGAAWLFRATNDATYLAKATDYYSNHVGEMFSWDDKTAGAQVLMAQLTGSGEYTSDVKNYYNWLKNNAKRTPKGLIWLSQWGSNRYAANAAFLMMHAKKLERMNPADQDEFWNLGKSQIDYILGDGGRSYVVGMGHNSPKQPHHRSSSCPAVPQSCNGGAPGANPFTLFGALVGGPDEWDNYVDDRNDYVANEVACDYNAGFQSALAAYIQQ